MSRILEFFVAVSLMMFSLLLFVPVVRSETEEVRRALEAFMEKLSSGDIRNRGNWGWNSASDPCDDNWKGIECVGDSIRKIRLKNSNLTGVLDASLLCVTSSLFVLSLENNNLSGELSEEISNCRRLRHLYLQENNFSGKLPVTLSKLSRLKRIDVSNNKFLGQFPEMSRVTGLLTFRAQFNELSGEVPSFDFSSLQEFNVSYNYLSGQISPDFSKQFDASSFFGNPALCGLPLPNACPNLPSPSPAIQQDHKGSSAKQYVIYTGYGILCLIVFFLFALRIVTIKKKKKAAQNKDKTSSSSTISITTSKYSGKSSESSKIRGDRSEYSIITSPEGATASPFMILGNNQLISELSFEELLSAPADLIGRGKHGSTYKVTLSREGIIVAVKRIKDWGISRVEFEKRIQKIDQVKHGNVLPVLGYYCSKAEKLLVYEYQQNGSLFSLLHESGKSEIFDWERRLDMAASIADALAFMHERLDDEGISHGNLKSSNILLLNNSMNNPCISEYGLIAVANYDQVQSSEAENVNDSNSSDRNLDSRNAFKADIYGYGVILLELLTGKVVQNVGFDLARWVHSVIREEWTAEVFDQKLIADGASEKRMVNLLQVALKCLDSFADARPNMREVAIMINCIKEDEAVSEGSDV
ncbi:hypothetical protein Leryth_025167 [Lithospermum erythrorhizon]|nr:hypothetical protein Leryth_025167 [Lithospermum erythrorhizon]